MKSGAWRKSVQPGAALGGITVSILIFLLRKRLDQVRKKFRHRPRPRLVAKEQHTPRFLRLQASVSLFQKQTHTVEVDYAVAVVERIHPQDPAQFGPALQQRKVGQGRYAKFSCRRFEVANFEIVDSPCTEFPRRASRKMC